MTPGKTVRQSRKDRPPITGKIVTNQRSDLTPKYPKIPMGTGCGIRRVPTRFRDTWNLRSPRCPIRPAGTPERVLRRVIPAWAGNRTGQAVPSPLSRVIPAWAGNTPEPDTTLFQAYGSSPCGRETLQLQAIDMALGAGNRGAGGSIRRSGTGWGTVRGECWAMAAVVPSVVCKHR